MFKFLAGMSQAAIIKFQNYNLDLAKMWRSKLPNPEYNRIFKNNQIRFYGTEFISLQLPPIVHYSKCVWIVQTTEILKSSCLRFEVKTCVRLNRNSNKLKFMVCLIQFSAATLRNIRVGCLESVISISGIVLPLWRIVHHSTNICLLFGSDLHHWQP